MNTKLRNLEFEPIFKCNGMKTRIHKKKRKKEKRKKEKNKERKKQRKKKKQPKIRDLIW
jgi:hypothetical protein